MISPSSRGLRTALEKHGVEFAMPLAPPGMCASGTLVGLEDRPEMNGKVGDVVGFGSGCYRVRLNGSALSDKPKCAHMHIKGFHDLRLNPIDPVNRTFANR